jgi:hypothetical protein
MSNRCKNVTGFIVLMALCITAVSTFADEVSWDATMQAAQPLHWYKFDEPAPPSDPNLPSDPNCYDYGSAGINGVYRTLVDRAQEGAFGPGTAVFFQDGNTNEEFEDIMYVGTEPGEGGALANTDWTAQFIVKKVLDKDWYENGRLDEAQALCDSYSYSIRLVGYNCDGQLGFVRYGVEDYEFDPEPGKSLVVPTGQWCHITFRKNSEGTQVFFNGEKVGTTAVNIDLPLECYGGRAYWIYDGMYGLLDEAVVFDRELSDFELEKHNFAYNPPLIPDRFELYEDNPSLLSLWSGDNATVELATDEVYEGIQSLKAVFDSGGGTIVKDTPSSFDYTYEGQKSVEVWFRGDPANTEGTITVTVKDTDGLPIASTIADVTTTSDDWNKAGILVDLPRSTSSDPNDVVDPNSGWHYAETLEIDVSTAGTLYFDKIEFVAPKTPLQKVLQWDFDHLEGKTVVDSVNGVNGVLDYEEPEVWVEDGGHTEQVGDHALYLGPSPNYQVVAYNVTAPEEVAALFDARIDFSINMWVNFYEPPVVPAMLGGFGLGKHSETEPAPPYSNRYISYIGYPESWYLKWAGVSFWPHYEDTYGWARATLDEWHMMTVTYDGWTQYVRIYLDAEEVGKRWMAEGLVDAEPQISISPLGYDFSTYFEGLVDDFSLWQGVLPWDDEDGDPTNDILSLYGTWVCPEDSKPVLDYDNDCRVGIGDFALMAQEWMFCGQWPSALCD